MPSVGITELKAHLSDYLRRTQAGERFYVTCRGVEVAELGPPDPVRETLLRMVADGTAEWSGEAPRLPDGFHPNPGRPVSDLVLEDRGPYLPDTDPEPS
jgi:prevent-host-death family protein